MIVKHKHCGLEVHYSRKGSVSRWWGPAVQGQPEWILYSKRHPVQVFRDLYARLAQR